MSDCPFCAPDSERVFWRGETLFAMDDAFPVNPGHVLIIPHRHVENWFDLNDAERSEVWSALDTARQRLVDRYHPDGFNLGVNVGAVAGQTVFHAHLHVIPRQLGDVPDPRGGVRHVVPAKANYVAEKPSRKLACALPSEPPLIDLLRAEIERATRVDLLSAFIQVSGLRLIMESLRDIAARGRQVRILTGDYLNYTDPEAMRLLLDLPHSAESYVFESAGQSFHPKAYIFIHEHGGGVAYVGSSNITRPALTDGIEWNYPIWAPVDEHGFREACDAFDGLLAHPKTRRLTHEWIDDYARRRVASPTAQILVEPPVPPPEPHEIQREALAALEATRRDGKRKGLVQLATGLGKTYLSAFDVKRGGYRSVLFVAHREEILDQAYNTFRRVLPGERLGRRQGEERPGNASVVFATVQTLTRHLDEFARDAFEYVVIDEFHHASAQTYRRILDWFEPRFLLGLTATPERTDGGDLWSLCESNLVYRCPLWDGIRRGLLSPFHYFGVPDDVDYTNIPWRSGKFDETALTTAWATEARAANALDWYHKHARHRTLAFCCSQRHANFMRDYFRRNGVEARSVHAGDQSDARAESLEALEHGRVRVIFAVDLFNEGLDVPNIDTIMMLRPTESRVLWLQQFGRGLRKAADKPHVTLLDYIGNHRSFLLKPQALFGLPIGDRAVADALDRAATGTLADLPPGCEVTYDPRAVDMLRQLIDLEPGDVLDRYYDDFKRGHNEERPTASEALADDCSPRLARTGFGSWLRFVDRKGDLTPLQKSAMDATSEFLDDLESTRMSRSYKMVVLLAMLNLDRFPGSIPLADLTTEVERLLQRSDRLRSELPVGGRSAVEQHLVKNPINAWTSGRFFAFENGVFASRVSVDTNLRGPLQELVRELAEWRLAEYLQRPQSDASVATCRVQRRGGTLALELPARAGAPNLPIGYVQVRANDQEFEAEFGNRELTAVRAQGHHENALPGLLREWFGQDAGLPGTAHYVELEEMEGGWELRPFKSDTPSAGPVLWKSYDRKEIPGLFGLPYKPGLWAQTGYVRKHPHIFCLVKLEKGREEDRFKYKDGFLTADRFQWESQNRTLQASADGEAIREHVRLGYQVHLFVRRAARVRQKVQPFIYCGPVTFESWEGEAPIRVVWRLQTPVPKELHGHLKIGR